MQIEFKGPGFIVARLIADSVSPDGIRLTTMELEYPRFIHSEFMTHRMLSKNSASSRAIPAPKMRAHIKEFPQAPVAWGRNKPGMQAAEELEGVHLASAKSIWDAACKAALAFHSAMEYTGAHKQIVNRVTEPFMQMKVVCSGTEWENLLWLRDHEAADPTIRALAVCIANVLRASAPVELGYYDWHLPYIDTVRDPQTGETCYKTSDGVSIDLDTAKKVSASCCAQVSYRVLDDSIPKALGIYAQLIESEPVHASPVEHQATPICCEYPFEPEEWDIGVTHVRKDGSLWSGNFQGWVQFRQTIPNHSK